MSFKVILAATGVHHSDADIDAAIELARAADAHLSVCVVALGSPPPIGEYTMVLADVWVEQRQALIEKLALQCGRRAAGRRRHPGRCGQPVWRTQRGRHVVRPAGALR
jgi:hypothetical protein